MKFLRVRKCNKLAHKLAGKEARLAQLNMWAPLIKGQIPGWMLDEILDLTEEVNSLKNEIAMLQAIK